MELIPREGAGALRFGMDEAAVRAILGEPAQRVDLAERRTALAFADEVDAVLHAEHGLVGISLGAGPATLFGTDLFALDRDALEALIDPHAATTWDPDVRIDGGLATLWASYDFHRGAQFSHCGADAFQLVRTDDRWRIAILSYTIQRAGCPPSPPR